MGYWPAVVSEAFQNELARDYETRWAYWKKITGAVQQIAAIVLGYDK